jgi:seryl-tRNA synthetase
MAEGFAARLGLSCRIDYASDPFFGRGGKLMAVSQIEQALKFELLIPVHSAEQPTACMSFNYHRDHFGATWNIRTSAGEVAHTGCVAFGIDRLALALFATHGIETARWPASVRKALTI